MRKVPVLIVYVVVVCNPLDPMARCSKAVIMAIHNLLSGWRALNVLMLRQGMARILFVGGRMPHSISERLLVQILRSTGSGNEQECLR